MHGAILDAATAVLATQMDPHAWRPLACSHRVAAGCRPLPASVPTAAVLQPPRGMLLAAPASLGRALACPFVRRAKAVFCLSTVSPFKLQDTHTGKTSGPPRLPLVIPHSPHRVPRSLQAPWGGALPVSRHTARAQPSLQRAMSAVGWDRTDPVHSQHWAAGDKASLGITASHRVCGRRGVVAASALRFGEQVTRCEGDSSLNL